MLNYTLSDDGTLDTVIECTCTECGHVWEERFSDTSDYSDEHGFLRVNSLMVDHDVCCENCLECLGGSE